MSLANYKKDTGRDPEAHSLHEKYMHWIIMKVTDQIAQGVDRETLAKVSWPSPWQLLQIQIIQVRWVMPKEVFQDYNEYVALKGDPLRNGLGDSTTQGPGGTRLVRLKREKLYKREVSVIQQAVKMRNQDVGGDVVSQGLMGDSFASLGAQLTGATLGGDAEFQMPALDNSPAALTANVPPASSPPRRAASPATTSPATIRSSQQSEQRGEPETPGRVGLFDAFEALQSEPNPEAVPSRPPAANTATAIAKAAAKAVSKPAAKPKPNAKKTAGKPKDAVGRPARNAPVLLRAALSQFFVTDASLHHSKYAPS